MADFDDLANLSRLIRRSDEKFVRLRKKVHRVLDDTLDEDSYDIYVNSILIDCRALFIENPRYKDNCTIQNFYKATNHPEYAKDVDEHFNRRVSDDTTLREVIKNWVDKHLVHFDFLDEETEQTHFAGMVSMLERKTIDNLFIDILVIAKQYVEYRSFLRQIADSIIQEMTGDT